MRNILTIGLLMFSTVFFAQQITANKLLGNWVHTSETYTNCKKPSRNAIHKSKTNDGCLASAHGLTTCVNTVFSSGKTYKQTMRMSGMNETFEGTYKIEGTQLSLTSEGITLDYMISLTNGVLTMKKKMIGCDYTVTAKKK